MRQSIKLYVVINSDILSDTEKCPTAFTKILIITHLTKARKKEESVQTKVTLLLKKNQILNNNFFLGSEYFYMVVSRRAFSLLSAVNKIKFLIINCVTSVQEKTHPTQITGICKMMKKTTWWNYSINSHQDMLVYCRIWLRVNINYFLNSWHLFSPCFEQLWPPSKLEESLKTVI